MNYACFMSIFDVIRDDISDEEPRKAHGVGPIRPEVRLAVAIRFLAGGSYGDISQWWGLSWTSVYNSVWRVCRALVKHFPLNFPHDDEVKLSLLASGFDGRSTAACMHGCVGALDGILVKVV